MSQLTNDTIWIGHKAMWKPDTYTFKDGFVTYYIEDYRLYAQLWRAHTDEDFIPAIMLRRTVEIVESKGKSVTDIENNFLQEFING